MHTLKLPAPVKYCPDCTEIFWIQLDDIDLTELNRNLQCLLRNENFSDNELWQAAKYMTESFLPRYFDMPGMQRQLPPSRLMSAVQTLVAIYGRPLEMKEVEVTNPIDIPRLSRMETSSVQSNTLDGSDGLSSSFKRLLEGQKPDNIPIKWGHGGQALFGGPGEKDASDDVLAPGRTYPLRQIGWVSANGGKVQTSDQEVPAGVRRRRKSNYESPSVETVDDDGNP
jgi:hypothetical protein